MKSKAAKTARTKAPKTLKTLKRTKSALTAGTKKMIEEGREAIGKIDFTPIWERVKKGLESTVEVVGKGTEKAAALAERAGIRYKLHEQHKQLQKALAELGGRIYDLSLHNPQALSPTDPDVIGLIGRIREIDRGILDLETKDESLKKAA